ncbi:reverse transcriptase, partial [Muribaculaceae bacterium Isolate-013 (NCI)]
VNYFRLAEMRTFLRDTDEWLRSRIRMCIWKCWKRVRTRFKNLQRCGIPKWQAWQWANTRKGYWRTAHAFLHRAISNENLKRAHYPTLTEYYEKQHPR